MFFPPTCTPSRWGFNRVPLHSGQVLSTQDLLSEVWGAEYVGEPQVVYVHIRWLREKLETKPEKPERILTVRGVGYKLIPKEA